MSQQLEAQSQQLETEKQRAEQAEEEVKRLKALLREQGIEQD